jgi:hypothetical protein
MRATRTTEFRFSGEREVIGLVAEWMEEEENRES